MIICKGSWIMDKLQEPPLMLSAADRAATVRRLFGTDDARQGEALLTQALHALAPEVRNDLESAYLVGAIIADIEPRDAIERLLATQMAAAHMALIRAHKWLAGAQSLPQADAHTNAVARLAKVFTAQVEALRRHRNGGSQTVRVEHVTVEAGAQAIIGAVAPGGAAR